MGHRVDAVALSVDADFAETLQGCPDGTTPPRLTGGSSGSKATRRFPQKDSERAVKSCQSPVRRDSICGYSKIMTAKWKMLSKIENKNPNLTVCSLRKGSSIRYLTH